MLNRSNRQARVNSGRSNRQARVNSGRSNRQARVNSGDVSDIRYGLPYRVKKCYPARRI